MITNKLKIIFGLLIIISFVYFRFIRERLLGPIEINFSILKLLGIILSIIVHCFIIYILFFPRKDTQGLILKLSVKIQEFYTSILADSYLFIKLILGYKYERLLENIAKKWYEFHPQHMVYLIIIVKYFFPLLIGITFFVEVCIYKKITYFPMAIFLIIPNIVVDLLVYCMKEHLSDFFKWMDLAFLIEELENENKYMFTIKDGLDDSSTKILDFEDNAEILAKDYVNYKNYYKKVILYTNLSNRIVYRKYWLVFRSIFWLMGWLGMLIYLIKSLNYF